MVEEMKTIAVWPKTKERMDTAKLCKDESYDSEINRIIDNFEANKKKGSRGN
jgi:hypothetical protein